jgi:hypothetical protein
LFYGWVAQSPKTGEIAVKRHGFGENHRKNTPKTAPNGQISKRTKIFFRRGYVKKSRSRAIGNLFLRPTPTPTFFFFQICQSAYNMPHHAGAQSIGK